MKPHEQATIATLLANQVSQREIHRKTGIDRKTIRKYARAWQEGSSKSPMATGSLDKIVSKPELVENPPSRPPGSTAQSAYSSGTAGVSACEPYREWIEKQVELGRNATAIYQDLVEQFAYMNKYNSVKRFVRRLKQKSQKRYDRLEFLPGEEAQVDYGQGALTRHPISSKYRRPRLFVMTLKYSRKSFRKVVWKSSKEVWSRLHEEAFRRFGGCPQYVVLDNLKEGVIKPDIYEPELNPVYSSLLSHYGVVADPARVGDPDRKGTVESAIQHTQDTALKGRRFESVDEQNKWLMHWEERWAATRIHGRAKRQVKEMFEEERPTLKPLPQFSFQFFKQETRTVWDDGCIQVGQSYYSALPAALYSEVIVRIYDQGLELIDPKTLKVFRRHKKATRPGAVLMPEEDRIYNPSRQTQSILKEAKQIGPCVHRLCELMFKEQGRVGQRRMRGIVALARKHKAELIDEACSIALYRDIRSSKSVKKIIEQLTKTTEQRVKSEELTQVHELIRPPSDYAAFFDQHANQGDLFEHASKEPNGQKVY